MVAAALPPIPLMLSVLSADGLRAEPFLYLGAVPLEEAAEILDRCGQVPGSRLVVTDLAGHVLLSTADDVMADEVFMLV